MVELNDFAKKMLQEKNFVFVATLGLSGAPQVTPTWVDLDSDGHVLVNTAIGRIKQKNTERDPRVALSVADSSNPYICTAIQGRVVEQIKGQTAEDHIDKMARKYLGKDKYPWRQPGERRVILKIKPEKVVVQK
jgi:PPOX class probable F420-dependent enzyme